MSDSSLGKTPVYRKALLWHTHPPILRIFSSAKKAAVK